MANKNERAEVSRIMATGMKQWGFAEGAKDATKDEIRAIYGKPLTVEERDRFTWFTFRFCWGFVLIVFKDGLSWRIRAREFDDSVFVGPFSVAYDQTPLPDFVR